MAGIIHVRGTAWEIWDRQGVQQDLGQRCERTINFSFSVLSHPKGLMKLSDPRDFFLMYLLSFTLFKLYPF